MRLPEDRPSIFQYENYRSFLKDFFPYLKKTWNVFSYRFLSRLTEMSPALIQLIVSGKRNLSHENATKLAQALKLTKEETVFFLNMVAFNQEKSLSQRAKYFERMSRSRKFKNIQVLQAEQYEYFSKWYYSAIREMVPLSFFKEDPDWIAQALRPNITPKMAQDALELLLKLGLVARNKEGRMVLHEISVSSGQEVKSLAIMNYHRQVLNQAVHSLEESPPAERDISSVIISVSSKDVPLLKKELQKFRQSILTRDEGMSEKHDTVYQFNMQLYPLSYKSGTADGDET